MTETETVKGFLERNRELLQSPYQVENLLRNTAKTLTEAQVRVKSWLQDSDYYKAHWAITKDEKKKTEYMSKVQEAAERANYWGKDIDFYQNLATQLKSIRMSKELEEIDRNMTIDNATDQAKADFLTHKKSFWDKLGEANSIEMLVGDATRRETESRERARLDPEDKIAKRDTEYWGTFLKEAQSVRGIVLGREQGRKDTIVEYNDGYSSANDLLAEKAAADFRKQLLLWGGVGLAGAIIYLYMK
jgi:hypothetical protein